MSRIILFSMLVAVFGFLQSPVDAVTLVSEDFEASAYVIDGPITAGGVFDVVAGPKDATNSFGNVVASSMTTGGTKSGAIVDTSITAGACVSLSTPQILALNGDTGIQKGSIQFDVSFGTITYAEINLLDDLDLESTSNNFTLPNQAGHIRLVASSSSLAVREGPLDAQTVGSPIAAGSTYRIKMTFDNSTDDITYEIYGNAPAFDQVILNHAAKFRTTDVDFKGIRYLGFFSNNANNTPHQFDNIIITDDSVTVPEPEVAVSVNSVEVANGGTIDCGAPDASVTLETIVRVANTGTADLTTSDLAVTGEGFAIKSGETLEATITPGNFDEFVIELNSASEGLKTGTLTFTTNDTDEGSVSINLTGDVGQTGVEDWQDR